MGIIRLLLALSVLIGHIGGLFGYKLVDPPVAVELFFIISGFYMAMILSEKYNSYSLFITNRFLKIYPAYLVVVLITLVSSAVYFLTTHNYESGMVGKIISARDKIPGSSLAAILLTNITIFGQDLLLFLKANGHSRLLFTTNFQDSNPVLIRLLVVPQAWSIALELMFYLIAPFLNKLKTIPLLLIGAVSLSIKIALYKNGLVNDPWTYRFFPAELLFFILGISSYRFYKSDWFAAISAKLTYRWSTVLYISFLVVIFAFSPMLGDHFQLTLLMAGFSFILPFIFEKFKRVRLDKKIGDFSYELYIAHEFCIYTLLNVFNKFNHHVEVNKVLVIIGTVVFSYGLSVLVTQKIDRFRQNRLKQTAKPASSPAVLQSA